MTKQIKVLPCDQDILEEDLLDMMEQDLGDEDVLAFLQECDNGKPLLANKIVVPETLALMEGYEGPVYGFIRED